MGKIKPILRYPGSKFTMLKYLIPYFKNSDYFIDVFGGSGIVGVNVKNMLNIPVLINDLDNILPPTDKQLLDNMLRFDGFGSLSKNITPNSPHAYFLKRIDNGYWDKVDIYRKILKNITITHTDYKDIPIITNATYYLDPPYFEGTDLYKNKINHKEFLNFANNLSKKVKKVIISYSKNDTIIEWYKDWNIEQINRQNTSGRGKAREKRTELIIWKEQSKESE